MGTLRSATAIATILIGLTTPAFSGAEAPPAPMLFYASQSGRPTLDEGEGGGNPFASALIELLSRADLRLDKFPSELRDLTFRKSHQLQLPDVPSRAEPADWRFQSRSDGETRVALVLVFSDYSAWDPSFRYPSLPGAKRDATRVTDALIGVGFQTETVLDPTRPELREAFRRFADRSSTADFAVLYTTGHGVEVDAVVYLIPNDYPIGDRARALDAKAYPVTRFASSVYAKRASLVFYGGCRDRPNDW